MHEMVPPFDVSAEEDIWFGRQNWGVVVLELLTNRNVKTENF
jgi:hypothetical protein